MPYDTKPIPGGFLRLNQIIGPGGPIPVSKSTWWAGVKAGRFPKPVKLSQRITAWRIEDIFALIAELNGSTVQSSASGVQASVYADSAPEPHQVLGRKLLRELKSR